MTQVTAVVSLIPGPGIFTCCGCNKKKKLQNEKALKNLTSKSKFTVKVGNHPYTKLIGSLKDKYSKINDIYNLQLKDTQNKPNA